MPALSLRYFDFGGAEQTLSTPRSLSAVRSDIPHPRAGWCMHGMEGFVPVALALAGASNVRVRGTRLAERESATRLISFEIDVSWDRAGALVIPPRTSRAPSVPLAGRDERGLRVGDDRLRP